VKTVSRFLLVFAAAAAIATSAAAQEPGPSIEGAWEATTYRLAGGIVHPVRGRIFFTESAWQVLFFVMDGDDPKRGSAEGGSYMLRGDQLTFQHHLLLAAGSEMAGLPETPLRMEARDGFGPSEPTRIELDDDRLTLYFPSGNSLEFRRRP
jgi:hypothetical protein